MYNPNHMKFTTLFLTFFLFGIKPNATALNQTLLLNNICFSGYSGVLNHTYAASPYIPPPISAMIEPPQVKDCTSEMIWIIMRHGTRTPTKRLNKLIRTVLPNLKEEIIGSNKSELCSNIRSRLSHWKLSPEYYQSKAEVLLHEGKVQMRGLAARYKLRFPNLFDNIYSNTTYKVISAGDDRSRESAKSFLESLFPESKINNAWLDSILQIDPALTFYRNCSRWVNNVKQNPDANSQTNIFVASETFQSMLIRMTKRLGLEHNLTFPQVSAMYKTCAYESAATPTNPSPWCRLFNKEDILIMEYVQDMSLYYKHGYGHKINYKPACQLLKHIVGELKNHLNNPNSSPKVILNFAHSGTILPVFSRLGFFKDKEPLKSDNFFLQGQRQWKTSHIDTFATNLGFVLYKCPADYVISSYFDEVPIIIPACNELVCSDFHFESSLNEYTRNCNISAMCSESEG